MDRKKDLPGRFELSSHLTPKGDQPQAIEKLSQGLRDGKPFQTLLGVTGSGKTLTMAATIQAVQRPALVISHNKTLAAQLCQEFRDFFPNNCVEYFVSYYDYYQPEAYIPQTDTYIEKDSSINEEIDRLRHSATMALFERRDVIIVASVSCIYGLGTPENYLEATLTLRRGGEMDRTSMLRKLVAMKYERNETELSRGKFRAKGDSIEILPAYEKSIFRVSLFGDTVEAIVEIDPITGEVLRPHDVLHIYPATHYVTFRDRLETALQSIEAELKDRLAVLKAANKLVEAQRLEQRTKYDLEMIREIGYCSGVENYSRHLDGRAPGTPPATLLDYFPDDYVMFIDESHVTVPQVRGMYFGDQSRKETLVEHGFRLPSAKDNRPLNFKEFEAHLGQVVFVSATPGAYEHEHSKKEVVEQIIRPTGLIDPHVEIRPPQGQIDDLLTEIRKRVEAKERVLVTTLTKRMAEELSSYFEEQGVRVRYLHSDVDTLDRIDILRGLRLGEFDVLVGINLLREGLDLPEVSLVAILDADKEGFLRAETSLIQTIGRAARNVNGQVILYADKVTGSMKRAMAETERRRAIQIAYNTKHGIIPQTVVKAIKDIREGLRAAESGDIKALAQSIGPDELPMLIRQLEDDMKAASIELEFERAAEIRDRIKALKKFVKR